MTFQRTYDDEGLADAIAGSRSWRGVLRYLGLKATSAGALRSARRRADELGIDYSHFTGQRRWSDSALIEAVAHSYTWAEVIAALGIRGGASYSSIRGHAVRLGLDTSHFRERTARADVNWDLAPDPRHLGHAGALLAAGWFALTGCDVSWPLEPCRYDLVVSAPGRIERVQVKTTTYRLRGAWTVRLGPGNKSQVYDPDDIDSFFIIDGELRYYLIPFAAVGGLRAISLSAYLDYVVHAPVANDVRVKPVAFTA